VVKVEPAVGGLEVGFCCENSSIGVLLACRDDPVYQAANYLPKWHGWRSSFRRREFRDVLDPVNLKL